MYYVTSQWTGNVQCSKKTGTPYHVREMNFTEFNYFKTLSAEMGSNFTVDENGDDVICDDIRVLQVKKQVLTVLISKLGILGNVEEVAPCQRISHSLLPTVQGHASLLKKKKDLLSLCCNGIIPSVYHEFYQPLPTVQAKK
ncbi:hypothetical protein PR048_013335, partial [Dryococelus australis]